MPPRIFMSVDLPAPFSPISASTSPFCRTSSTSRNTATPENALPMPRIASNGGAPVIPGTPPRRASQQPVRLQDRIAIRLVDGHGGERDLMRDLLARHQLHPLAYAFRTRRCVKEGRGQRPVMHPFHAEIGDAVDAEELHLLLASRILGGEIGAIGHRVVVAIDEVDLVVRLERRGHDVVALLLLP